MKKTFIFLSIIFILAGASLQHSNGATESEAPKLSEKLSVFKSLIGPTWVGSIPNDSRMGEIVLKWEVIMNGFAVRLKRNILNFDHWLETTYYWDESAGKIAYLAISNNDYLVKGYVSAQGEEFISEGVPQGEGAHAKVRRIYKLDKDGKLYEDDLWLNTESDGWHRTHISVFVSK